MSSPTSDAFDPYTQTVTLLMADGVTPFNLTLQDIDSSNFYNEAHTITYASQLGACLTMFFVVIILTKDSKRRNAIFILNVLSLLFGFLRTLLLALYFTSPWTLTYPSFSGDNALIPRSAYATSIAGTVFPLLMTITVNLSLILQAHTVCSNLDNTYRYIVSGLSVVIFLLATGFRFAQMVTNSLAIMTLQTYFSKAWIQTGTLATETISIWFFSLIFTGKLGWTLYNRRRNGWKQWSGVRILAAMGGCTMIIPSIFASLEYITVDSFPEAGTLALTMVALLLPLSSLWASMAIDQESSTLNLSHLSGSQPRRPSDPRSEPRKGSQLSQSTAPSSRLEYLSDRKGSSAPISPTSIDSRIEHVASNTSGRDSTELDLEAMGVRVDRSYSIHSCAN